MTGGPQTETPVVDITVPVRNEAHVLATNIERLHNHLCAGFPYTWRITIADSASTDATLAEARRVATALPGIRVLHVDAPGRGRALRTSWTNNDANVLAYMDVDLSTGLDALIDVVRPLVSGEADIAIGSRLAPGANVTRRGQREFISRRYNQLLRAVFRTTIHDAQCGFKAVRASVAARLLPSVVDQSWFFDTELLLLAEHHGLRIREVPVTWIDDPDSRVQLARTAVDDLKGIGRLAKGFARERRTAAP